MATVLAQFHRGLKPALLISFFTLMISVSWTAFAEIQTVDVTNRCTMFTTTTAWPIDFAAQVCPRYAEFRPHIIKTIAERRSEFLQDPEFLRRMELNQFSIPASFDHRFTTNYWAPDYLLVRVHSEHYGLSDQQWTAVASAMEVLDDLNIGFESLAILEDLLRRVHPAVMNSVTREEFQNHTADAIIDLARVFGLQAEKVYRGLTRQEIATMWSQGRIFIDPALAGSSTNHGQMIHSYQMLILTLALQVPQAELLSLPGMTVLSRARIIAYRQACEAVGISTFQDLLHMMGSAELRAIATGHTSGGYNNLISIFLDSVMSPGSARSHRTFTPLFQNYFMGVF